MLIYSSHCVLRSLICRQFELQCIQCKFQPSFEPESRKKLYWNFGVIPPWLEKILNIAPLKCLEMLQNHPIMWQLSNELTDIKKAWKNTLNKKIIPGTLFLPQMSEFLIYNHSRKGNHSTRIFTVAFPGNSNNVDEPFEPCLYILPLRSND